MNRLALMFGAGGVATAAAVALVWHGHKPAPESAEDAPASAAEGTTPAPQVALLHTQVSYSNSKQIADGSYATDLSLKASWYQRMTVSSQDGHFALGGYAPDASGQADMQAHGLNVTASAQGKLSTSTPDGSWSRGQFDRLASIGGDALPPGVQCHTDIPTATSDGAGMKVGVSCSVPVSGSQSMQGATVTQNPYKQTPVDAPGAASVLQPMGCSNDSSDTSGSPDGTSQCGLEATLISTPPPAALAGYAMAQGTTGLLYGATYTNNSTSLSFHYSGGFDQSEAQYQEHFQYDVTVWTTGAGDTGNTPP